MYGVAVALAALAEFLVTRNWLSTGLASVAACIAGCGAVWGVFQAESIGEGVLAAVIVGVLLAIVPKTSWVVLTGAAFVGLAVGMVCVGKEFP